MIRGLPPASAGLRRQAANPTYTAVPTTMLV